MGTAVLYIVVRYVQMDHLVQNHILDFAFRQFISDVDPQFQLRVPNNQSILVFDGRIAGLTQKTCRITKLDRHVRKPALETQVIEIVVLVQYVVYIRLHLLLETFTFY